MAGGAGIIKIENFVAQRAQSVAEKFMEAAVPGGSRIVNLHLFFYFKGLAGNFNYGLVLFAWSVFLDINLKTAHYFLFSIIKVILLFLVA